MYLEYHPADCDDIFYLTPLKRPKGDTWYSKVPIEHNTLSKMVSRLCSDAGILGFKTNHSLRVTSATHSGADEQLIISRTRHRSVDGVHTYKWESQEQKRSLSNVLNAASNGQPVQFAAKKPKLDLVDTENRGQSINHFNTQHASTHTAASFNFTGCSSFHHYQLCKQNYLIIIIQVLALLRYSIQVIVSVLVCFTQLL